MDLFNKSKILANLVVQKNLDVFSIDIPEDTKLMVYTLVGYEYMRRLELERGITILEHIKEIYKRDFIPDLVRIAIEKLTHKEQIDGLKILEFLESRGYKIDYSIYFNIFELIELTKISILNNDRELTKKLVALINKTGGKDALSGINDMAYHLINSEDTFESGIDILSITKEYSQEDYSTRLKDLILNRLKRGELDFGLRILKKSMDFVGNEYLAEAVEIGYKKIAQGKTEEGTKILEFCQALGAQIDESILLLIK